MRPKRLVLMLEGEGDARAVPNLVNRIIAKHEGYDALFVDEGRTFTVGNLGNLRKKV